MRRLAVWLSLPVLLGYLTAVVVLRRRLLAWGATPEEAARRLPGDELVPDADLVATRAITIDAAPEWVWPWLIQIGTGRAGAYSYDWLDRLAGLDMRSSWQIVPEFQDLAVGDVIPIEADGTGLRVRILEADRVLGTVTDDGTWSWTWLLEPMVGGTRVLSRTRMSTTGGSAVRRIGVQLFLVPASWMMERKMLLGLRERVEGRNGSARTPR